MQRSRDQDSTQHQNSDTIEEEIVRWGKDIKGDMEMEKSRDHDGTVVNKFDCQHVELAGWL